MCFVSCSSQIRQTLKKKAFEEAGIPVKQVSLGQAQPAVQQQQPQQQQTQPQQQQQQTIVFTQQPIQTTQQSVVPKSELESVDETSDVKMEGQEELSLLGKSAEMTLNRLNTQEVDVDSLASSDVKLEFDTEEVAG